MRHRKAGSKFNRNSSHRNAMFRNMVTSLLKYERIKTTDQKAKVLRGWADHIITLAKRGDLHARRQAMAIVMEKEVVHKVFEEAPERFGSVAGGGYTRVIKLGRRQGDAAMMSLIEIVAPETKKPTKKKAAKKTTAAKTTPVKEIAAKTKATADSPAVKKDKAPTLEKIEVKAEEAAVAPAQGEAAGKEDEPKGIDAAVGKTADDDGAKPEDSGK